MTNMHIIDTNVSGLKLLKHHVFNDERGRFSRVFCRESLEAAAIAPDIAQINVTQTVKRGCLRGMHYQKRPHSERKIICCLRGSVFDVVVDLRRGSSSFLQWRSFELNGNDGTSIIVPAGFAHGFIALSDDVEMLYLHDKPYVEEAQRGVLHNDPRLNIHWPIPVTQISDKDTAYPPITPDFTGV